MKDFMTFAAAIVGGTLLAGGNDLGLLFLIPSIIYSVKNAV
jgi:hypothetical protein